MLTNPVFLSVVVVLVLSLAKLNVLISLIIGALVAGFLAGIPLGQVMEVLVSGMGGNAETALNYILLGALAATISQTGLDKVLAQKLAKVIKNNGKVLVLLIGLVSIFSQNLIPVHIAFIPILIPPLIPLMNKIKIDRRAVASALTFGLKAPYLSIPAGYGLIFHGILRDEMSASGLPVDLNNIWQVMWIPGLAMLVGFLVAVFISYRKDRDYDMDQVDLDQDESDLSFTFNHLMALIAAVSALVIQLAIGSLALGAIVGIGLMLLTKVVTWSSIDKMLDRGIGMMGYIAFVMLVAAGYGEVIRQSGGIEDLVASIVDLVGNTPFLAAVGMILVGLFITLGIGTSFGTIPIIAAIYVPLALELGFSGPATILLVGTAAALGDAGSPASDSTLGPTAGLNVDGQHDHIQDTVMPTFLHYNTALILFGLVGASIL
ncbi:Na+/H+ antiporter family protein [Alloiococcus otitis]|uniref:Na+/H+ antiporter family protein n=1 Tax=Alloiococcus otitis TaxID=1652 RepID=UPI0023579CF3|nr:Na+/H+ antiporter NhaC family protein [Alloiococcus otitis]